MFACCAFFSFPSFFDKITQINQRPIKNIAAQYDNKPNFFTRRT